MLALRKLPAFGFLFVVIFGRVLHLCNAQKHHRRQVWAWAVARPSDADLQVQQLRNSSWSGIIDGIQVLGSVCRWTENGIHFNETRWNESGLPLLKAARDTGTKYQLVIAGDLPDGKDPEPFIQSAVAIRNKLGIDGFSIDDERDCAPRGTLEELKSWVEFHNGFARGLQQHGISTPFTSAVQAVFGIQDIPNNKPCSEIPSHYPFEPQVADLLASATFARWLVMDTYYFSTGRFMGVLDWHVANIPRDTLAISVANRDDLDIDDWVARFYAIDNSRVDWVNFFKLPIDDIVLPLLQRWKSYCRGCGSQTILGCYDTTIDCDFLPEVSSDPGATE